MNRLLDADFLTAQLAVLEQWLFDEVLTLESFVQLVVLGAAFGAALWLGPRLGRRLVDLTRRRGADLWLARLGVAVSALAVAIVWLLLTWFAGLALSYAQWPHRIVSIGVSLLAAWVVIRLVFALFHDPTWSKVVAVVAWTVAALNIVGVLDETVTILDSASLTFGSLRISALIVIKGIFALAILLWVATVASSVLERRIDRARGLTPSVRVLFTKLTKVLLIAIAVVAALQSVGIDLSAFTVFTGALGVGIGFGLQKSVSNLFSGVMILMDKSIKPGDVIEVAGTYGWVNSLGSRYVSVTTRDGVEHLIPNEDFITQRVSNWSFSNDEVRQRVEIGVSYDSDLRQAIALCLDAARESRRVVETPAPVCLVTGFGDSSVDLELRFWIRDPRNGIANVRSEVLLHVWDKFHAAGISIPYPQRDLHLKSAEPVRVTLDRAGAS